MSEKAKSVFSRPAIIIIMVMVLINAGVILYAYDHSQKADQRQQQTIERLKAIAKENQRINRLQNEERNIRVDQSCELFETDHLKDVNELRERYRYVVQAEPVNGNEIIYRFVVASIPQIEQEAKLDSAPDYCDEPGVGLPEPDPVLPERPAAVTRALKSIAH